MRLRQLVVITLCIVCIAAPVLAKEKKDEKAMDPQAMMELWKQAATPDEPHKLFATLAGSWTTQTKEWRKPGQPPMESIGTAESKMLLGGRFLHQEYDSQMMGQPFTGISIDAYDNIRKKYVTVWMDTRGTGVFIMEGTASPDGKTITLRGSHPSPVAAGRRIVPFGRSSTTTTRLSKCTVPTKSKKKRNFWRLSTAGNSNLTTH